uniref:Uncharacterized protein n=1 Tax=Anopheles atroparvus TaxID=41427 RepID=A0AAG5CVL9_ANOAO
MHSAQLNPLKRSSSGNVSRKTIIPYTGEAVQQMGHHTRKIRRISRNNTVLSIENTRETIPEADGLNALKASRCRWSSAENLTYELENLSLNNKITAVVELPLRTQQPEQGTISPENASNLNAPENQSKDAKPSKVEELTSSDRYCSMIPLLYPSHVQPTHEEKDSNPSQRKPSRKPVKKSDRSTSQRPIPQEELGQSLRSSELSTVLVAMEEMKQSLKFLLVRVDNLERSRQEEKELNKESVIQLKEELNNFKIAMEKQPETTKMEQTENLFFSRISKSFGRKSGTRFRRSYLKSDEDGPIADKEHVHHLYNEPQYHSISIADEFANDETSNNLSRADTVPNSTEDLEQDRIEFGSYCDGSERDDEVPKGKERSRWRIFRRWFKLYQN